MKLVKARLNRLSSISADIGQVFFASIVIPFLLDKFDFVVVILGLVLAVGFWFVGWLLARPS